MAEICRKVAVSPVRRPSSIRAQLITAATTSAQRIQDFGPELGRSRCAGSVTGLRRALVLLATRRCKRAWAGPCGGGAPLGPVVVARCGAG